MFTKRYKNLKPYIPGEQPKDKDYIKLNANENPYPPSPRLKKILNDFYTENLRLYPDPDSSELCSAIAKMLGNKLTKENIFVGNGSDEVLSFVFYALFDSNAPVLIPEHTYSFYPVYAGYYEIPLKKIPLNKDFTIDEQAFLKEPSSGVIFANPNAPTSLLLSEKRVRSLLLRYPKNKAIVVDEAYADFTSETVLSLIHDFPNLVVIRTFSKGYSFAGARLGYAVAQPKIIKALLTTKNSFNHFPVDAITQKLGIESCLDKNYYAEKHKAIIQTRNIFSKNLLESGWDVLPSETNFVLTKKEGLKGIEVYEKLKEHGFLVRHFSIHGISNYVRITIGLPEQMENLFNIMKNF